MEKEIEQLRRRRQRAQAYGDLSEEAKICNQIGDICAQNRDHRRALHYHRCELSLSEATGDKLGAAIAHRRVGECECELGNYDTAISHQQKHLEIAKSLGELAEVQRALTTLGRTYLHHADREQGNEEARELLLEAGSSFLKSLDMCDKLLDSVPEREVLRMRSRSYLNLGLVYENRLEYRSARGFMEKALGIVRELGESETVFKCHLDLGSLHLKECHAGLALRSFQEALAIARSKHYLQQEADTLREMARAHLLLSDFEAAKLCLKKVSQFSVDSQGEMESISKQLHTVRKVLKYSHQVGEVGMERVGERMALLEKLGDLCCAIGAYPAAIEYYGQQLSLAEAHGVEPKDLSKVYYSLASTHADYHQYSQAMVYYEKELKLWQGCPAELCSTWSNIARLHEAAAAERKVVLDAYKRALELAKEANSPQDMVAVHKSLLKFCQSCSGLREEEERSEKTLHELLTLHPDADVSAEDTDTPSLSEDSPSLPSSEEEEEEEEEEGRSAPVATRGIAVRRKRTRLTRRNENGETVLHVAAIDGNLGAVRQLVREGADVNARDHCGWTPLHEASNKGRLDVVRVLLDGGSSVNDPGGQHCAGITPLMDAATNGHQEVVKLLVERGADLLQRNNKGQCVVEVLEAALSSVAADSGQRCELTDDHVTILEYLKGEMRKKGYSVTSARRRGRKERRSFDRTGESLMYNSSDDDEVTGRSSTDNPFSSFTVGGGPSTGGRRPQQLSGSIGKNPLGQIEMPALIPEDEEEEEGGEVVNDWLIDDLVRPPPSKKRRHRDLPMVSGPRRRGQGGGGSIQRTRSSEFVQDREKNIVEVSSSLVEDTPPPPPPPPSVTHPLEAPLRIRVRIQTRMYMVPCPRRDGESRDTTVAWLITQAAERYYNQEGVRPLLSLTTSDGALLSPADPIAHVLQDGEEVLGVVEHWELPPLAERYQAACKGASTACHRRVVKLFRAHSSTPCLDLSDCGLRTVHAGPIFHALQGQHTLSSLSFSGNRLRDSSMPQLASSLTHLPSLHSLDLSCTGITARGIDSLATPTRTPPGGGVAAPWSSLRRLVLSYNDLGCGGGRSLAGVLRCCTSLQILHVDACGLSGDELSTSTGLPLALKDLSDLSELSLAMNPLEAGGVSSLLGSLTTGRLKTLNLSSTCTSTSLSQALTGQLTFTASLEHLDISHCCLGDEGLVKVLGGVGGGQELSLSGNGLTAGCVGALCGHVLSTCVTVLDLSGNTGLRNAGCLQVIDAAVNSQVTHLSLNACGMSSPLPLEAVGGIPRWSKLVKLELSGNTLDSCDLQNFCDLFTGFSVTQFGSVFIITQCL